MSLPKIHIPEYDHRLWILFFGMGLNQFGMSIVMPFISIYLYYYQGISAALVGFAIFFSSFIGAIFQLIGGELCDRIGRRSTFIIGLVMLIASFLLLAWAVSTKAPYTNYLLILSMTRIATGLFRPIPNIIAADIVPPGKRLEAFALLRIGQNAGFALGPMVGGVMALLSYSSMFYFTAATSSVYLIIILLFIKDTRTCAPKNKFTLGDIGSIRKDRAFVAFCLLTLFVSIVYSQMYTPLSVYAKGFVGLSEPEIGMLFAINGIMVVLMQFVVTRVMDRYSLTRSMGIGVLLYAIGFGLVAFSNSFLMLGTLRFYRDAWRIKLYAAEHDADGQHVHGTEQGTIPGIQRPPQYTRFRHRAAPGRHSDRQARRAHLAHRPGLRDHVRHRVHIPEKAGPGREKQHRNLVHKIHCFNKEIRIFKKKFNYKPMAAG